jgi:hypothetical protein
MMSNERAMERLQFTGKHWGKKSPSVQKKSKTKFGKK